MPCQSCEGCNICNTCKNCTVCMQCDNSCNGEEGCLTIQSFCAISSQSVGGFNWSPCITSGEFIFSASAWNKIIDYIEDAYARGKKCNGGTPKCKGDSVSSRDLFYASDFNNVSYDLHHLESSESYRSVSSGELVQGSYFTALESAADSLKYYYYQCDECNVDCDVPCDSCQGCNKCEQCNTCQDSNTSYACCESTTPDTGTTE